MVCKFNVKILEKWGITEETVLKGSYYLLHSYWPCKQKDLFAVLIFPSCGEDSQAVLATMKKHTEVFISWFNCCETQKVALSSPLVPDVERSCVSWKMALDVKTWGFWCCFFWFGLLRYLNWNWSETIPIKQIFFQENID